MATILVAVLTVILASTLGQSYIRSHPLNSLVVRLGEYDHANNLHGIVGQDFSAADIFFHPLYSIAYSRYSLVLIKLNSTVSFKVEFIKPVCLPWGLDSNKNLTGQKGLVVAPWNTLDCKFLRINIEDKGAPLVTMEEGERYVAAGILGYGFFCGVEEFPAPYNNLRYPENLAWIKNVAFTTH
ncbi:uncharacterized protein LOC123514870 [Portunus trituberculatus]|uniref:uncharacterized protein LOC123514870 n=1 Tax=Portunus trituberculatus TaxID=210409 RepID=UPI001E1D15CD|nr:uncharacterized protein LOC123514870 [Portunus trituberculatus]